MSLTCAKASEENNDCKFKKEFKISKVKDLMRVHLNGIDNKIYFCNIPFKIITRIMTDDIIPEHIRSPGIS